MTRWRGVESHHWLRVRPGTPTRRSSEWELNRGRRDSRVSVSVPNPYDHTPIFLNTIAAKRKSLAGDKLDKIGSVAGWIPNEGELASGVILEPECPPEEGR